ncbi:MAG TPA: hypothetical protein DEH25_04085 [Chloroflexi bacterium]|nr:hypothetical protein [Chloroflexota bacterium]
MIRKPNLLSGLAVCVHCGSAMVVTNAGKNLWPAYLCGKKSRRGQYSDCQARLVGKAKTDQAIIDLVLNRILTLEFFAALLEETRARFADTSKIELQLTTFEKSLALANREISNLLELAATFGAQSAGAKIVELETEQTRLKAEIKNLETQKKAAQIEISPEALALTLSVWRN